mmetsp:Transcript_43125/g.106484  ORF Transcript_43125/g.106484 Transcript_43125/m.106484 type:complete len:237 (-) Transcript_43125:11-721(-)
MLTKAGTNSGSTVRYGSTLNCAVRTSAQIKRLRPTASSTWPIHAPDFTVNCGKSAANAQKANGARTGREQLRKSATAKFAAMAVEGMKHEKDWSNWPPDAPAIAATKTPSRLLQSVARSKPSVIHCAVGANGSRCQPPAAPRSVAPWMTPILCTVPTTGVKATPMTGSSPPRQPAMSMSIPWPNSWRCTCTDVLSGISIPAPPPFTGLVCASMCESWVSVTTSLPLGERHMKQGGQ